MIKPTFYNLPDEKKQRLYEAARKEFTRVSYNEASINKIIKDAQISRGSFYTYFDEKSDLAKWLLGEYFKTVKSQIDVVLQEGNGDIFEMFTRLFDVTVEYTELKDNMELFHSLFRSMRSSNEFEGYMLCDEQAKRQYVNYILGVIDRKNLNISSDEELENLLELMLIITKQSVGRALSKALTKDAARQKFLFKLNIIKNGVLK